MQMLPDEMGAMQPIGVECVFGKEGDVFFLQKIVGTYTHDEKGT